MRDSEKFKFSEYSELKQQDFTDALNLQLAVTKRIYHKLDYLRNLPYLYFDLHAGPGKANYGKYIGSPIRAIDLLRDSGLPWDAYLFESNPETFLQLMVALQEQVPDLKHVHPCPNRHEDFVIPQRQFPNYGLVYVDPSNGHIPADLLARFGQAYKKVDILINVAAGTLKRVQQSPQCSNDYTLEDVIDATQKKHWLIRPPQQQHQWVMLFGANFLFPEYRNWIDLRSDEGRKAFDRANLTNEALKTRFQLSLFGEEF